MKNLRESIKSEKFILPKELQEYNDAIKEVEEIELKLKKVKNKKNKLLASINERKQKIKMMENSLMRAIEEAKKTSDLIVNGPKNLDLLKRNYLLLEVEVGRIREDIK